MNEEGRRRGRVSSSDGARELKDGKPHRSFEEVLQHLNKNKYISLSVVELFKTLKAARNSVAHTSNVKIAREEAKELTIRTRYLTELLGRVLEQVRQRQQ